MLRSCFSSSSFTRILLLLFIYYTISNQSCSFAKLEHGSEDTSIDDCFLDQRNLEERKRAKIREESREISNLYVLFSIYLSPLSIHVTYVSVCLFSQSIVHPRTRVGRCRFTFHSPLLSHLPLPLPGGEVDCPSWKIIIGVSVIILHVSSLHPCHLIHASIISYHCLLLSMPYGGGSLRGRYQIPLSLSARLGNLKWAESSTSRHITSHHFTSPVSIHTSVTHSRILSCFHGPYFAFRDLVYLLLGVNMVSDYSRMIRVGLEVPIAIWIPHVLDVLLMPDSALLPISLYIRITRHSTCLSELN